MTLVVSVLGKHCSITLFVECPRCQAAMSYLTMDCPFTQSQGWLGQMSGYPGWSRCQSIELLPPQNEPFMHTACQSCKDREERLYCTSKNRSCNCFCACLLINVCISCKISIILAFIENIPHTREYVGVGMWFLSTSNP